MNKKKHIILPEFKTPGENTDQNKTNKNDNKRNEKHLVNNFYTIY